jgi:NAD(P)-dependent dehydrogenase (short-subunit alcohol dehydrogenase family)
LHYNSKELLRLTFHSGIGLETCILFAREGANVLMADISAPALEKASLKLKQLVPSAHKVEIQVSSTLYLHIRNLTYITRSVTFPRKPISSRQ